MKRFLPTLILVVVCIGGFWYASSQSFFKDKSKDEVKQLMTVSSANVESISVKTTVATTALVRKGEGWEMAKPSILPVAGATVEQWLGSFSKLTYNSKVNENPQALDLAGFGLAEPQQEFKVTMKDGSSQTLWIGMPLAIAGNVYAKLANSPVVYEISDQAVQSLAKQPLDFIDKRAVQIKYDAVKKLQVEWKTEKWQLDKAQADKTVFESTWKLGDKELKPNEGTAILDKVVALATKEMVKPAAEVKLDQPDLKLLITEVEADKETIQTYLGKIEKEMVWIVKQGGAWAYSIPLTQVQELIDTPKNVPAPAAN